MRAGIVVFAIGVLIASAFGVVTLIAPRPGAPSQIFVAPAKTASEAPPISPTGPYPKVEVSETVFKFGRMDVGDERSHAFTIRNTGEAPLVLKQGPTTCQCTVSNVEKGELAPGESATVTLTWKPTVQAEKFHKSGHILTNDPERKDIEFSLIGMVAPRLLVSPMKEWTTPNILPDQPTVIFGMISSPVVDKFDITGVEVVGDFPYVSTEVTPLEKSKLDSLKAICGYQIQVTIKPEMPIGTFTCPLKIKTDVPSRKADGSLGEPMAVEILVTGQRHGPLRIVGSEWDEDSMSVYLSGFDAAEGKTVILKALVQGTFEDELKFVEPSECPAAPALKVSLERDETAKSGHHWYRLRFEYPPGAPRASFREGNPAIVRLRTNHPGASTIEIRAYFTAI